MLFRSSSRSLDQGRITPSAKRTRFFDFSSDYGDTLKDAKNVGTIKRGKSYSYSGDVGGDDLDYFKFKLDRRSGFSARLNNKSDDNQPIAITLLNGRGKPIKNSGKFLFANVEAGESQTISLARLAKGTYHIRLQSANGRDEDYDLSLSQSRQASSGGNQPGFDQSEDLGTLQPGRQFSQAGRVGGRDIDFYRFRIDDTSRIFATLDSADSNADPIAFSILDNRQRTVTTESGRFLFGNVDGGESETIFAPTLAAGTYLVRVQSEQGRNEPYQLTINRSLLDVIPI